MQFRLPALSSALPLGFALPAFSQSDIADIDVYEPSGLRVLAASKGVYFDSGAGFLQDTAYVTQTGEDAPLVAAIDPLNADAWIAVGGAGGGAIQIARMTGQGQNIAFVQIPNSGLPADIDFAPDLAGWVLIARRPGSGPAQGAWAIYSTNGGTTWSATLGNGLDSITQIAFDRVAPSKVVAFTEAGAVKLSFNRGQNWSNPVASLGDEVISAVGSPHAEGLFFAATTGKTAWRSEDGGFTWVQLPVTALKITVSTEVPDLIWITDPNGALRMSADAGATWSSELDVPGFGQGKGMTDLVFDSASQRVVAVGEADAYGEVPSAVERVGAGTEGSGGVQPRILLGGVLESGNGNFALLGDSCVSGGVVVQWASRFEAQVPLFGGILSVGGPIVLEVVTVAKSAGGMQGVPGAGDFRIKAPLPNNPAIAGAKFMTQFAVVDTGAADPSGIVLSPALEIIGLP